jgi:hypothetical protein
MRVKSLFEKIVRHPVVSLFGGLAIGGIAIGIAILILVLVVEPVATPELEGTVYYKEGDFVLRYQKDSAGREDHAVLAEVLKQDYEELLDLLDVNPDLVPTPIDVFVHDDVSSMQTSISKRKSPEARSVYLAPLDLLVGEDPRGRMAELILAFGWGRCGSQILHAGTRLYATEPERDFHAVVAALPDRLFLSLPELIRAEERGRFPESLYQQFDSPYSPVSIAFSNLRKLFGLSVHGEISPEDILVLEAASFIQFLIETKGGIRAVKQAWGRGSTVNLLNRIDSAPPEEMGTRWYEAGIEEGRGAPDFPFLSVYYLLGGGFPDTAWTRSSTWHVEDLSQDEIILAVRCSIAVGAFTEARALISYIEEEDTKDDMQDLLTLYKGWTVTEARGLRIFVSPQVSQEGWPEISQIEQVYERMINKLALPPSDLPERMTLFFHSDTETREQGESLIPLSLEKNATLHLLPEDNVAYRVGEVLPVYAWGKDTYSRLLRAGVAMALSCDENLLVEEGCGLRQEGRWFSLSSIDFGMASQRTVEVEAGLLLHYILKTYGGEALRKIWVATSPLDRYLSFDTALTEVCATTREEIEESLFSSLLSCNEPRD